MLLKVILLVVGTAAIYAERAVEGPYASAGWRPRVPFNLPGSSVEISQARVEHAGTFDAPQLNSNYLPPQLELPNQQHPNPLPIGNKPETLNGDLQTTSQQRPATQYGAPVDGFRINYPDEEDSVPTPESLQNIKEGSYYIVSSDKKLQRVDFRTMQSTADATGNDFTAQLRYSALGELQDPIYRYNSQGQLERVLK